MKNFYYLPLLAIIALMSSCAMGKAMLLTKESKRIENVFPSVSLKNDTLYYQILDDPEDYRTINDTVYSIHMGEILSGLNYINRKIKPYYIELPTLPKDTIVDITGSSLVPRTVKFRSEYVLSLSADENYVLREKQLASFYQQHSPEAYALYKKGNALLHTSYGMLAGFFASLIAAECLILCSEQIVGYESVIGSYGIPMLKPIYGRNDAMFYSGLGLGATSLAFGITAVVLEVKGIKKHVEALDTYHIQTEKNTPKLTLNTQISGNGVGVALQF
jgi:hypothetical protein